MKKENRFSKRTYLIAFVFVMLLNLSLAIFLIHNVFAQTSNNDLKQQPPIAVEVLDQKNSPILITVINVDNSAESQQVVNFTVQNLSQKRIRAYVLLHSDEKNMGGSTIEFFQSFDSGKILQSFVSEARANIKTGSKMFLSLDFVEFEDGSSWGKDSQNQSEYIGGHNEGRELAVKKAKQLLQSSDDFIKFMQEDLSQIKPSIVDDKKDGKWQRGLIAGYRSVLVMLQITYETQGLTAVPPKLEQIEKTTKKEGK